MELPWSPWAALLGGNGLLRLSFTSVDVDDEGVRTGDWVASREPCELGEAVPSFASLFFLDLESLSFVLES